MARARSWKTDPATKVEGPGYKLFTTKESACDRNAVGNELPNDDETEDGGDSDRCCKGEEAKESRDESREPYGIDRNVRVRVHAVEVAREGKSTIPREREDLA